MAGAMNRVCVSGLNRAARRARERLGVGISPAEVEGFRAWIPGRIERTEAIYQERSMSPEDHRSLPEEPTDPSKRWTLITSGSAKASFPRAP
mgnify:CR=1 FL=1